MSKAKAAQYKSPKDLKGMKIGVTAPGLVDQHVRQHPAREGRPQARRRRDHRRRRDRRRGRDHEARRDRRDLQSRPGDLACSRPAATSSPVIDTRTAKGMQDVYGGAYAAGCIYVPVDFAKKYPNTAQAVVNAMVRALRFIQTSTPDQIVAAVPPEYYTDKRAVQGRAGEEHRDLQARRHRSRMEAGAERAARPQDASTRPCRTRPSTSRRRST